MAAVVDAPRAGAAEEGEGAVVRVEHHLLALARVGAHEHHPAVAEPDMGHLHGRGHPVDDDDLVAPVELVGLARREAERHERRRHSLALPALPGGRVAAHRVVAAVVAESAQLLEDPGQGKALSNRARRVRGQKPVQLVAPGADLWLGLRGTAVR